MSRITINSNQLSLNAQRRLGEATSSLSQSFSRLSSGLRINRAVDDAAGLAISETLKTDSRLSSQALRNVNDGISMISIINGALEAQKGIFYRMAELAEQSANGVMSSAQRKPLQAEYMALQEEFDRVASSAKFNGNSLLRNPDPTSISLMAGVTGADSSLLTVAAANSHRFAGIHGFVVDYSNNGVVLGDDINLARSLLDPSFNSSAVTDRAEDYALINLKDNEGNDTEVRLKLSLVRKFQGQSSPTALPTPTIADIFVSARNVLGASYEDTNQDFDLGESLFLLQFNLSGGSSVSLSLDFSGVTYENKDWDREVHATNIGFTNVESQAPSRRALEVIHNRINDLSKLQGEFGAVEARLSVAANQLSVNRENFQAAASQITDVDVATEAATLTRTQILQQSAAAVLAQANQQPDLALRLLRDV